METRGKGEAALGAPRLLCQDRRAGPVGVAGAHALHPAGRHGVRDRPAVIQRRCPAARCHVARTPGGSLGRGIR
eukprot:6589223-Prymnesium_polylepis.1